MRLDDARVHVFRRCFSAQLCSVLFWKVRHPMTLLPALWSENAKTGDWPPSRWAHVSKECGQFKMSVDSFKKECGEIQKSVNRFKKECREIQKSVNRFKKECGQIHKRV